jgi:hypothetical protein
MDLILDSSVIIAAERRGETVEQKNSDKWRVMSDE